MPCPRPSILPRLPRRLRLAVLAGSLLAPSVALGETTAADRGRALFAQHCAACHDLVHESFGPPLGGIMRLLSTDQLTAWIARPTDVLASGDARAQALLGRYKVPMPPFAALGDDAIAALIAHLTAETEARNLSPRDVRPLAEEEARPRLVPPVADSGIVLTLDDVAEIPRLPDRPAYAGIALLRPDPRDLDALLVNDLMGPLYRVEAGEVRSIFDLREYFPAFVDAPGVASGFGAFAFHPDFLRNGLFYTTHSELWQGEAVINPADVPADIPPDATPRLAWTLSESRIRNPATSIELVPAVPPRRVMRWVTPTTGHGSQEIAFAPVVDPTDPDYGLLYIGHGDGGSINIKQPGNAGHPRSLMGAVMRIDPAGTNGIGGTYGIPPDNPYAHATDPAIRREIWATGFRNVHRFSWDLRYGKRLIGVDIGETNIEEVNLIAPGRTYGWGVAGLEGPARIDVLADPTVVFPATPTELAGTTLPHGAYDHHEGQAITGGYVYHGPFAVLRDKYIFGDIVNGRLFCMNFGPRLDDPTIYELHLETADGQPTTLKKLAGLTRAHLRVSYDPRHGSLYLLTKDDGKIRRVTSARIR